MSIEVEDDFRDSYDGLADQVERCEIDHTGHPLWLRFSFRVESDVRTFKN